MCYDCAYYCSFLGFAEDGGIQAELARVGKVYRGLSIIEQAPLGGCEAPPSPLSFRQLRVVLWRIVLLCNYLGLGLGIVGYLIPVWVLAIVCQDYQSHFRGLFYFNQGFLQLSYNLTLLWFFFLNTLYAVDLLIWVNRMTAVAGTRFTNSN